LQLAQVGGQRRADQGLDQAVGDDVLAAHVQYAQLPEQGRRHQLLQPVVGPHPRQAQVAEPAQVRAAGQIVRAAIQQGCTGQVELAKAGPALRRRQGDHPLVAERVAGQAKLLQPVQRLGAAHLLDAGGGQHVACQVEAAQPAADRPGAGQGGGEAVVEQVAAQTKHAQAAQVRRHDERRGAAGAGLDVVEVQLLQPGQVCGGGEGNDASGTQPARMQVEQPQSPEMLALRQLLDVQLGRQQAQLAQRAEAEHLLGVAEEAGGGQGQTAHEAADELLGRHRPAVPPRHQAVILVLGQLGAFAQVDVRGQFHQRLAPGGDVPAQQFADAPGHVASLRVVLVHRSQPALKTDELGSHRLAVVVEPVGVNEARRVIVGMRRDVGQEALLGAHGCSGTSTQRRSWWLRRIASHSSTSRWPSAKVGNGRGAARSPASM
jgi:hypothetical protein